MNLRDVLSVPVKETEIGDALAALVGAPELQMVVRRMAFGRDAARARIQQLEAALLNARTELTGIYSRAGAIAEDASIQSDACHEALDGSAAPTREPDYKKEAKEARGYLDDIGWDGSHPAMNRWIQARAANEALERSDGERPA